MTYVSGHIHMLIRGSALKRVAPTRVFLVTAIISAVIMGDSMIYNVLPSNVVAFGVPAGLVGVLLSANRFVRLASNPLAAWAFQRFGLEKPLLFGIVLSIGTTVAYGAGHGFVVLLFARLLWGVCYSLLRLGGYLVVLEDSPESSRARLIGFFIGGQRAGSIVGVLLGGLLFDVTGRTSSFLIIAAFGLLSLPVPMALANRRYIPTKIPHATGPPFLPVPPRPRLVGAHNRAIEWLTFSTPGLSPRRARQLLTVAITIFIFYFAINGVVVSTLGFFLSERLGDDGATIGGLVLGIATLNGVLLAINWLAALAAPYLGHLADRFGRERVTTAAIPVCLVLLLLLALPGLLWLTLIWLPVAFVCAAAVYVSSDAIAGGLAPIDHRAQVMSRYATWQDTGSALGPLLAYAVLGIASLAWVYAANVVLLGAAFALFLAVFRQEIARRGDPGDTDDRT